MAKAGGRKERISGEERRTQIIDAVLKLFAGRVFKFQKQISNIKYTIAGDAKTEQGVSPLQSIPLD